MEPIITSVVVDSANQRGYMLDGNSNEIIEIGMWVIGSLIAILAVLELCSIKQEPKSVDDKRDWCKTKEKDKKVTKKEF